MLDTLGENVAWQLQDFRENHCPTVTFNGVDYHVTPGEVAGAKSGEQGYPKNTSLGPMIAALDPHVFIFSPGDFQPNTDVYPPTEGDILIWHELEYKVTNFTFEDMDATVAVPVYCLRNI